MTSDRANEIERRTTRRSILKASLVASTLGIGGTATGLAQTDDASDGDTETHTLTVALVDSNDASVVSGDVTVDGQTKTTAPVDGDPAKILTTFELENGTYTVSGESDFHGETWRANDQEVTIDGADESVSLLLHPPDSDELDDAPETHTLSVYLVESSDADIVSGDVTVNGETKPTEPIDDDPRYVEASFELEDGTYTVSATSEYRDEIWRSNEQDVTIDGADRTLELYVYPPDSDELDGDGDIGGDAGESEDDSESPEQDPEEQTPDQQGSDEQESDANEDNTDEKATESSDPDDETAGDGGTEDKTNADDEQQSASSADTPTEDCPDE